MKLNSIQRKLLVKAIDVTMQNKDINLKREEIAEYELLREQIGKYQAK